jgi:hypothetical protein
MGILAPSDLPPPILVSRSAIGWLSAYAGGCVNMNVYRSLDTRLRCDWRFGIYVFKFGKRKVFLFESYNRE